MNMRWRTLLQKVLVLGLLQETLCSTEVLLSVQEEQPEDVEIGTISHHFTPPFWLLTPSELVRLDERTGELYTTAQPIDREALCPLPAAKEACLIQLLALAGPDEEIVKVAVEIEDINDNTPTFPGDQIRLSVPEDITVGTRFPLDDQAQDDDAGSNGELRYHLEGADGFFSTDDEGSSLVVIVRRPLDRETRDTYQLTVVASDRGIPSQSATVPLVVKVTDVNDNCPTFPASSPKTAAVRADAPTGTMVASVKALDPDLGPNAAIKYSFSPRISDGAKVLFTLDSYSGLISLHGSINRDGPTEHVLRVEASGPSCPPAVMEVTVSLLPATVWGPVMKIRYIADYRDGVILIEENQPPTVLAIIELEEASPVKGAPSIAGGVPFSLRPQNGNYLLLTSEPLDYEKEREYHVSVAVHDGRLPGGREEMVIRALVQDVNDNAPQFEMPHYQLNVEENNEPGVTLVQVRATDLDSWQNGEVTYRLGADVAAMFSIDPATGRLSALVTLDREQQEFHNFTILARDNGRPFLESTTMISVRVLDQNDNEPVFTTADFIFFIPENFPRLGQVGMVGVRDSDAGANGQVEVQVLNGSGPFVMDNARGTLRCVTEVDRERQDHYELWLLANDGGRPPRSASVHVTIFVEDVNDNRPRVILPASNLSCLTVSPSTPAGATVAKIYAVDEDSGINSDISYRVAASEPRGPSPFQIDARSGNITLGQRLLLRDHGLHHLFIVVSDGGEPTPLQSTVWVNLLVNDTLEPCHLSAVPVPVLSPYTHLPPRKPVCEADQSDARYARTMLFISLGLMAFSASLFAGSLILFIKQMAIRRKNSQGKLASKGSEIPLKLRETYSAVDWTDMQ